MAKRNLMGLQFSRVSGVLHLEAPAGCKASVLLKSVGNDGAAEYVWWLSVGRHGSDAFTMSFDCKGANFIRCDVPEDHALSELAVHNELDVFLKGPAVSIPVARIQGGPTSGNGDGGTGPINPH